MSKTKMEYDEEFELVNNKLEVYKEQYVSTRYRVFVDEVITNPSYYRDVLNVLYSAKEEDIIEFRLNTDGGQVRSVIPIMNGILGTEARTIAIVEGVTMSAGTFILLACDEVEIRPFSGAMVHAANGGFIGDMQSLNSQVNFEMSRLKDIIYQVYEGFMSEEEIREMIEDSREFYMNEDELISRLKNRQEYQKKKIEEALAAKEEKIKPSSKKSTRAKATTKTRKK